MRELSCGRGPPRGTQAGERRLPGRKRPGLLRVPGFPAVVQDSTGAGDGFAAGFLAAVAGGLDRYDAAVLGNAVGALVAGWVGADGTMEVAGDLLPLLREAADRAEPSEHCTAIRQVVRFLEQRFSALEE